MLGESIMEGIEVGPREGFKGQDFLENTMEGLSGGQRSEINDVGGHGGREEGH